MQEYQNFHSPHFTVQELAEGIFAAIATDGGAAISNSGVIDLGGKVIVFDTFLTLQAASDLRGFVEQNFGHPPKIIINSHYHNDHIWGNQVFLPEAQVISSSQTRDLICTQGVEEFQWYSDNAAKQLAIFQSKYNSADSQEKREQFKEWIGYYRGLVECLPNLSVTLPDITFTNRVTLHGSKRTAELITFEGAHTGSDTMLFLPKESIVFMGDLLFVDFHAYLAEGDPNRLLDVLRETGKGRGEYFVPGHGPVGTLEDINLMVEYIEHCQEAAHKLASDGGDIEEQANQLLIPEKFGKWGLMQFYQVNIRSLCQRMVSKSQIKSLD